MFRDSNTVIIAEDNKVMLELLSEIFKECGYSVRTASDGLAALALVRSRAPGILLSDLHMPRMSGLELLSIVRRRYPAVKVIAMSGSYRGENVPPEVAADAFYQKGATSVARLLQIVDSLKDEDQLRLRRVVTPIWVSGPCADLASQPSVYLGCPECLRAHPRPAEESDFVHRSHCPYCGYAIQLAIVPPYTEPDELPLLHLNS